MSGNRAGRRRFVPAPCIHFVIFLASLAAYQSA